MHDQHRQLRIALLVTAAATLLLGVARPNTMDLGPLPLGVLVWMGLLVANAVLAGLLAQRLQRATAGYVIGSLMCGLSSIVLAFLPEAPEPILAEPGTPGTPGAVLAGDGSSGLHITHQFLPLMFLLLACFPHVEVNGEIVHKGWWYKRYFIPLQPGTYEISVYFPYMWRPKCGPAELTVQIGDGEVAELRYGMWIPFIYAPGSLKRVG